MTMKRLVTKLSTVSVQPPKNPAVTPKTIASAVPMTAETSPTSREPRAPAMTSASTSWPDAVVPSGWAPLGGLLTAR